MFMEIKLNIVNISVFSNLVCRCNVVPIKRTSEHITQKDNRLYPEDPPATANKESPMCLESILFFCLKYILLLLLMLTGMAGLSP